MFMSFFDAAYWRFSLAAAAVAFLLPAVAFAEDGSGSGEKTWVYVGTYTGKNSKGIYRFDMDLSTGKLTGRALAGEVSNPSFLALHPKKNFLYAVGEDEGKKSGAVNAFSIDRTTGDLTLLNREVSEGAGPCHLVVDKAGKNVLVANYGAGSVAVLPIESDGKLAKASCSIQHKGSGADPSRQQGPHAHSINLDAANNFAVVADLGLDKVLVYRFDGSKGTITPNDPPFAEMAGAAGPRHFAFHPNGKFGYVINEMNLTVTAMSYDPEKGEFKKLQTISTLPKDVKDTKGFSTAEVVVHPSGKWLYGSNRGHDTIAIFKIDEKTGELTAVGHQGKGVKVPRNFAIAPGGKFLLVANQAGDSIVVFKIDQKTGELEPTDIVVDVPAPVCIRFWTPSKSIFD
jgi:6-phosphogluconolactonase